MLPSLYRALHGNMIVSNLETNPRILEEGQNKKKTTVIVSTPEFKLDEC
jgi:hypothetical protein